MATPARKVTKSVVKNIVRFPPIKANDGEEIVLDSIQEAKFCLHLEFDPEVTDYFPQPQSFDISGGAPQSTGAAFRSYVPDFLVHYREHPRRYIEVKRRKDADKPDNQEKFRRFETRHLDPRTEFQIVDEAVIYAQPRLGNLEFLYRYRKNPHLDMRKIYSCANSMKSTYKLANIIDTLSGQASLKEIYSWIAFGFLCFDLDKSKLNNETELKFDVS